MADWSPNVLIITLSVNGLTIPIKRQILTEWILKHDLIICYLQKCTSNSMA